MQALVAEEAPSSVFFPGIGTQVRAVYLPPGP